MSTVIVIEIIGAILLLAAVVAYAVRDTQRRSQDANSQEYFEPEHTHQVPAHGSQLEADQHLTEASDRA